MAQINPYLYERESGPNRLGAIIDVREVRHCRETDGGLWVAITSVDGPERGFVLGLTKEESYEAALEIMVMKSALGGN